MCKVFGLLEMEAVILVEASFVFNALDWNISNLLFPQPKVLIKHILG